MTPKIVLAMIMKNEERVLPITLQAVLPLIDAYAIVDTGSTDSSKEVARKILAGLPGEIVDAPWTGFADARNRSLDLAAGMGDWTFILDADDVVTMNATKTEIAAQLDSDAHPVTIHHANYVFTRPLLLRSSCPARFRGVVHEFLDTSDVKTYGAVIAGAEIIYNGAGTSDRNVDLARKYARDIELLENAIAECDEPALVSRYIFYLAQSYKDSGQLQQAYQSYGDRTRRRDGYDQEKYVSYLQLGHIAALIGSDSALRLHMYLMAYDTDPARAEAQFHIAEMCRENHWWQLGWKFILDGQRQTLDRTKLFVDSTVYDWRLDYEMSIAAFYTQSPSEGREACLRLLARDDIPPNIIDVTVQNLTYYPG